MVRALVVINPGNPTGGVLSKANQARGLPDSSRLVYLSALHVQPGDVYNTSGGCCGRPCCQCCMHLLCCCQLRPLRVPVALPTGEG